MLVDDTDNPNSRSLEYLAVRVKEFGYEGRVSASHCGALAAYDHAHAEKVMGLVRDADITIVSNALVFRLLF
jgi:cytosine deaminase